MTNVTVSSKLVLWGLLALPACGMFVGLTTGRTAVHGLLHPTGEFAARFMIIAMMATPLRLLFPHAAFPRWLIRSRRAFGVAAAAYATVHTALYIADKGTLQSVLAEFLNLGIWTGWIAMLIFVPLALTSNNWSVSVLGASWKVLQRLVYPAAVATLAHWIFIKYDLGAALAHFVPLAALESYRIGHHLRRSQIRATDETKKVA